MKAMDTGMRLSGVVFGVLVLVMGCSHPRPTVEEERALSMLQSVQQSMEQSPSCEAFSRLLGQAEVQLNRLKQNPTCSPCFVSALSRCVAAYQIIGRALNQKQGQLDDKRREEIDTALSFTLAFAAVNIKQAMDCYHP